MKKMISFIIGIAGSTVLALAEEPQLVVHEWGTFTTLQDPHGRQLGAINEAAEPLPDFVKNLIPSENGPKGFPVHPAVTMRLETPVVYFHLPQGAQPVTLDYSASFRGGLLTQYYPDATTNFDQKQQENFGKDQVTGSLTWKNLTVGKPATIPETKQNVWLAPRKVNASDVTNEQGEGEKYLFYRGVGHLNSPVYVRADAANLYVHRILGDSFATPSELMIRRFWYIDIENNQLQYQTIENSENMPHSGRLSDPTDPIARAPLGFPIDQLRRIGYDAHAELRKEIKSELVEQGLFDDEAEAMLNTWDESYFKSPGKRVLFIVPKKWVDFYLPVKISVPAKIQRVMIGRVDLLTSQQQDEAKKYLEQVLPKLQLTPDVSANQQLLRVNPNRQDIPTPNLGRYTNAIIWDAYIRSIVSSHVEPG